MAEGLLGPVERNLDLTAPLRSLLGLVVSPRSIQTAPFQ